MYQHRLRRQRRGLKLKMKHRPKLVLIGTSVYGKGGRYKTNEQI